MRIKPSPPSSHITLKLKFVWSLTVGKPEITEADGNKPYLSMGARKITIMPCLFRNIPILMMYKENFIAEVGKMPSCSKIKFVTNALKEELVKHGRSYRPGGYFIINGAEDYC